MRYQYLISSSTSNNSNLVTSTTANIRGVVQAAFKRLYLHNVSAGSDQSSHLLRLPSEMRLAIYEALLSDESDSSSEYDGANLLQTCRQLSMEAQPVIYQRPKSFTSQGRLFSWMDRSSHSNLERVRTLTLHLTDVDLSPLLNQNDLEARQNTTAWSLYQADLDKLENALRSLPNLASLSIVPPKESSSMLLKGFYHSFLAMIASRCPKLRRLELHDSADILDRAPSLNEISQVTFTRSVPGSGTTSEKSTPQKHRAQRRDPKPSSSVSVEEDFKDTSKVGLAPPTPRLKRQTRRSRRAS